MTGRVIIADARARRIGRFVDQLGLYIARRSIETSLPTAPVHAFMNEVFGKMVKSKDDFPLLELLGILCDEDCCEEVFLQYRKRMVDER